VKLEKVINLPNVKIVVFLYRQQEARYAELQKLIRSRGALSNAFKELVEEELIQRRVDAKTKPAQSYYSLTKKGRELGAELVKIRSVVEKM
jgi:DNA-binding HxlR family transcriptional regulator